MTKNFVAKAALALVALAAVAGVGLTSATPAQARVIVGFGFGPWWGYPYPYAPYPYAYPYPYYAPPPAAYAPGYAPGEPDPGYATNAGPGYAAGPTAAASGTWYYCDNPQGYYPYVQRCGNWRAVPAQPRQQ